MNAAENGQRETQAQINARILGEAERLGELGARARRGGAVAVGAQLIRVGLQLVSTSVMARLLLPDDFGVVAMGMVLMAFITVFTETSLSSATIQRDHLTQDTVAGILFINLGMSGAAILLAIALSPFAADYFGDQRVVPIVIGLALALPLQALGSQNYALLTRNMKWIDSHICSTLNLACGLTAAIIAAWVFNAGFWALVVQQWVTSTMGAVLAWWRCPWRPTWVRNWSDPLSTLRFGFNLTGALVMNFLQRQMDSFLIGGRWGTNELGFYSRAYNLLMVPLNFVQGPIQQAMVPALSRLQNEPDKWRRAFLDGYGAVCMVGGAMSCILFGGADPIIDIVFGPGWQKTADIFAYLAIGIAAATPMTTVHWIYISLGRTNIMFYWSLFLVPCFVFAYWLGLDRGGVGVASNYAIAQLLALAPSLFVARWRTPVSMLDIGLATAIPLAVAAVVGASLRFATAHLNLWGDIAAIMIAGLLYVGAMAAAVWTLPMYARLKTLAINLLTSAHARVSAALNPSS